MTSNTTSALQAASSSLPDTAGGRPVIPSRGRLRPLGLGEVRITGGFWATRQRTNAEATLGHIEYWLEREGWLGNFDAAAEGRLPIDRKGREFSDSETYKLLEAMAWEIGRSNDEALERRFLAIVERVASAQEPDGYLNTNFGRPGQGDRYSDLEWGHELYCYGHLIQAAVARARTRGADLLVDVARRSADHICGIFGAAGISSVCGHAEIETALVELYRVTGERRYLDQAQLFIDRRGNNVLGDIEFGRSYFQDDIPLREATVMRGHAVRATYLAAGGIDLATETGDAGLAAAISNQLSATLARRTYLTGGMGSRHQDEAFGDDFMLPPDQAYSETCAAIGSVMLNWRLLLADGEPVRADLIERTLYNVVATSPSHRGTAFYYTNTLHQRESTTVPEKDFVSDRAVSSMRAPWFSVSCCPSNVARMFASLGAYIATCDDEGLQLHQYAASQIRTALPDGRAIAVDVETDYPKTGEVIIRVLGAETRRWTLTLRIPSWASAATVSAGGETWEAAPGRFELTRAFAPGDEVRLMLPIEPHFVWPDPRIDAVRGCVAVERGPEVLCVESVDLPYLGDVNALLVDTSAAPTESNGAVFVIARPLQTSGAPWPYSTSRPEPDAQAPVAIALTPYHDWANRGPSTMRVWIPTT